MGQSLDGVVPGDRFGRSESISGDGYLLPAGGYWNDCAGCKAGHVRLFLSNTTKFGSAIKGQGAKGLCGEQIWLSKDGTTLAAGSPFHDGLDRTDSGNVRVFTLY